MNPFLITTHCIAHRLNLASHSAFETCPELTRFEETIKNIHSFFSYSPKRYSELEHFQLSNDEPILKLGSLCETRWSAIYDSLIKMKKVLNLSLWFSRMKGTAIQILRFFILR